MKPIHVVIILLIPPVSTFIMFGILSFLNSVIDNLSLVNMIMSFTAFIIVWLGILSWKSNKQS